MDMHIHPLRAGTNKEYKEKTMYNKPNYNVTVTEHVRRSEGDEFILISIRQGMQGRKN